MDVDEDSEQPAEGSEPHVNGVTENGETHSKEQSHQQPKRKLKLKYEQYRIIANSIVIHMRHEEEKDGTIFLYRFLISIQESILNINYF